MRYGYVRDSRQNEENINKQIQILKGHGAEIIVVEKSGHDLNDMLSKLQERDELHIVALNRISRDKDKCLEILGVIFNKKIEVYENGRHLYLHDIMSALSR